MNRFDYLITLKRGTRWDESQIRKVLKLDTTHTWNLTTVSTAGKIQEWDKITGINDIMEAFYNFRLPYVEQRIKNTIMELEDREKYLTALKNFCNDNINGNFSFKGLSDDEFKEILKNKYKTPEGHLTRIMNMPVRMFTVQMMEKLSKDLLDTQQELHYYLYETTPEKEYAKDLAELKSAFTSYEKENQ